MTAMVPPPATASEAVHNLFRDMPDVTLGDFQRYYSSLRQNASAAHARRKGHRRVRHNSIVDDVADLPPALYPYPADAVLEDIPAREAHCDRCGQWVFHPDVGPYRSVDPAFGVHDALEMIVRVVCGPCRGEHDALGHR